MLKQTDQDNLLRRIDILGRELERLRRDLLHAQAASYQPEREKPSLFGAVRANDITPQMIEEARESLFRPLEDI